MADSLWAPWTQPGAKKQIYSRVCALFVGLRCLNGYLNNPSASARFDFTCAARLAMLPSEILPALELTLQRLVQEYQELNARHVPAIAHTPSALEFSQAIAANRPLVFRGQGFREDIPALKRWTNAYLEEKLGGRRVAVAVSPDGFVSAAPLILQSDADALK